MAPGGGPMRGGGGIPGLNGIGGMGAPGGGRGGIIPPGGIIPTENGSLLMCNLLTRGVSSFQGCP